MTIASTFVRCSSLVALSLPWTVFIGTVAKEDRDVLLLERTPGKIVGAMFAGKGQPALVTGTIQGNHVVAGPIDATVVWKTFDGKPYPWDLIGTWSGAHFDFWNDSSTTRQSLLNYPDAGAVPYDRLHDDIRAKRWPTAEGDAQLVCLLSHDCDWTAVVRALGTNRKPPMKEAAPWRALVHERAGRLDLAEAAAKSDCERYSRIGCRFYLDYASTRDAFHLACRRVGVACDRYWGADAMALIDAAHGGDEAEVRRLIAKGVDVNAGGEARLPTALQNAAWQGSLPIVEMLVGHGAKVDVPHPPSEHLSPLANAIDGRHQLVALFLLEHGASIHRPGTAEYRDESLLVEAAGYNEARVVHKMLAMGEKPDDDAAPAGSALTIAVDNRNVAMVRDLIAHGADPDFETNHSLGSPIEHARRTHQKKMLRLLLAARKAR